MSCHRLDGAIQSNAEGKYISGPPVVSFQCSHQEQAGVAGAELVIFASTNGQL